MDIREEFEKSEHIKERLAICYFDTNIGCYLSIQLRDYASASYLNGAWYAFQEQQKKIDAIIKWVEENKKSIPLSEWHGYTTEEYVDADDLLELLK